MRRVADQIVMIARRVPKARGYSPWRGAQRSEHAIWSQPMWDMALKAVCCVASLAKGTTLSVALLRASPSVLIMVLGYYHLMSS